MKIVHFCPDDRASSGVNTFCVELDRHLRRLGVDSRILRTFADLATLHQPPTPTHHQSPFVSWDRTRRDIALNLRRNVRGSG